MGSWFSVPACAAYQYGVHRQRALLAFKRRRRRHWRCLSLHATMDLQTHPCCHHTGCYPLWWLHPTTILSVPASMKDFSGPSRPSLPPSFQTACLPRLFHALHAPMLQYLAATRVSGGRTAEHNVVWRGARQALRFCMALQTCLHACSTGTLLVVICATGIRRRRLARTSTPSPVTACATAFPSTGYLPPTHLPTYLPSEKRILHL